MLRLFSILIVSLFTTNHIFSQEFSTGDKIIGGTISASFQSTSSTDWETKTRNFGIYPNYGQFLTSNLALGLSLRLQKRFNEQQVSSIALVSDSNLTRWSITPFARYYLNNFFAQGKVGYGTIKNSINETRSGENFDSEFNRTDFSYEIGLGCNYFLTENLALEAFLGYQNTTRDFDTSEEDFKNTFFSIGIQNFLR